MSKSLNFFMLKVAVVAAFAGILFGFDTGVISGAILYVNQDFALDSAATSWVVSSVLLGALIGATTSGYWADYFGRKRLMLMASILFLIGTIMCVVAAEVDVLIWGRLVVGFAIGMASFATPLYLAELAPERYRGALVSLNQVAVTIGMLVSYMVDYHFAATESWRMMFGFGLIPSVLLLLGVLYLPASPRWLMAQGKEQRAREVLRRVRADEVIAENELKGIRDSLKVQHASWRELFKPTVRPTFIIAATLAIIQQVTGINTILYYTPTIFSMTGFSSDTGAILATMGIGFVIFLCSVFILPMIDTVGRRKLLLIGIAGMALGLLLFIYVFSFNALTPTMKVLALGSLILYAASFAISLGPIMWLLIAELFPLRVRGVGASLAMSCCWIANLLVASTFLLLIDKFDTAGTFFIYFICCLLSWIFVYRCVPETKGVTLETIESNLYAGKPWRELGA